MKIPPVAFRVYADTVIPYLQTIGDIRLHFMVQRMDPAMGPTTPREYDSVGEIVMTPLAARELANLLTSTLERHEAIIGPLPPLDGLQQKMSQFNALAIAPTKGSPQ